MYGPGPFGGNLVERLSVTEAEPNKHMTMAGDANSFILSPLIESDSFDNVASEEEVEG